MARKQIYRYTKGAWYISCTLLHLCVKTGTCLDFSPTFALTQHTKNTDRHDVASFWLRQPLPAVHCISNGRRFPLIINTIRAINVDRINSGVLAPLALPEIACHRWQTNISTWPLWQRGGNNRTFPAKIIQHGIDLSCTNHTSELNKWLWGTRSIVHDWRCNKKIDTFILLPVTWG